MGPTGPKGDPGQKGDIGEQGPEGPVATGNIDGGNAFSNYGGIEPIIGGNASSF